MIYHRGTEDAEATEKDRGGLTHAVIGAAIEVHRHLGPGLLESVYEVALCSKLWLQGLAAERQVAVPLAYKGAVIRTGVPDLIV